MSVLDQIKKLDEQRATLLENAKKEAMGKAESAIADLNSLGFSYSLTQKGKGRSTRNTDPAKKFCTICETNGHDGRAHRSQGKKKQKFTAAELKELGL